MNVLLYFSVFTDFSLVSIAKQIITLYNEPRFSRYYLAKVESNSMIACHPKSNLFNSDIHHI